MVQLSRPSLVVVDLVRKHSLPASSRQSMHWLVEKTASAFPLSMALMSTLKMWGLLRT